LLIGFDPATNIAHLMFRTGAGEAKRSMKLEAHHIMALEVLRGMLGLV